MSATPRSTYPVPDGARQAPDVRTFTKDPPQRGNLCLESFGDILAVGAKLDSRLAPRFQVFFLEQSLCTKQPHSLALLGDGLNLRLLVTT